MPTSWPVAAFRILPNILKGSKVASATAVAATGATAAPTVTADTAGFLPVIYAINITQVTQNTTRNFNLNIFRSGWLLDAWVIKTGGTGQTGDQIILRSGTTNVVSSTLSLAVINGVVARSTSMVPQYFDVDPTVEGIIRGVVTAANDASTATRCLLFIKFLPTA